MTLNPGTGRHECDRCGADLANGGLIRCAVVSDLDPDNEGMVRALEFCRDRPDPDNDGETIRGCAHRLVSPSMIRHYTGRREAADA